MALYSTNHTVDKNPIFVGYYYGSGQIYWPENPTILQVKYELSHYDLGNLIIHPIDSGSRILSDLNRRNDNIRRSYVNSNYFAAGLEETRLSIDVLMMISGGYSATKFTFNVAKNTPRTFGNFLKGPQIASTTLGLNPEILARTTSVLEQFELPLERASLLVEGPGLTMQWNQIRNNACRLGSKQAMPEKIERVLNHNISDANVHVVKNITQQQVLRKGLQEDLIKFFSKETQRLLGVTNNRYKGQLFERPGKLKSESSLRAAQIELEGGQIPLAIERGQIFDHIRKVENAQKGLKQHIQKINSRLSHPELLTLERQALEQELSKASILLDHTEIFVPRTNIQSTHNFGPKVTK